MLLIKRLLVFIWSFLFLGNFCWASDPVSTSSKAAAISFVSNYGKLEASKIWPGIKPAWFMKNLNENITNPASVYPGEGSYFCSYSAITYLMLQDDPLGYAKFALELYNTGKAVYRNILYEPSESIKKEAGRFKYKGVMDIHPLDQMWYLTLADHYKGYLNLFNRKYDAGDENSFWASSNYGKFNRMAKKLLYYNLASSKGSDLFRPHIKNLYSCLAEKLNAGKLVLFINNRIVHKKDHVNIRLAVPTHFIVVEKLYKINDVITMVYWENGAKTQMQLSPAFLKRIVYGITAFTNTSNE